jgi:hypothetical protein
MLISTIVCQRGWTQTNVPAKHVQDAGAIGTSARTLLKKLPLQFEENRGQFDSQVRFVTSTADSFMLLRENGLEILNANGIEGKPSSHERASATSLSGLDIGFVGSHPDNVFGAALQPTRANSFAGRSKADWHTRIPTFRAVNYSQLYPGIDATFYGSGNKVEFDLLMAPGADVSRVGFRVSGAQLQVDGDQIMASLSGGGSVALSLPAIYQLNGKEHVPVSGSWQLADGVLRLRLGGYDKSKQLIVDPTIVTAFTFGRSELAGAPSVAVGSDGSIYIAESEPNPGTSTYQCIVRKVNATGTALLYTSVVGSSAPGSGGTQCSGIALDPAGNAYVVGQTFTPGFPLTANAANRTALPYGNQVWNSFLSKVSADGSELLYSTYLNVINSSDPSYSHGYLAWGNAVAVDGNGKAYVASTTYSYLPSLDNNQVALSSYGQHALLQAVDTVSGSMIYTLIAGGSGSDAALAVAVDASGNAIFAGETTSPNFYPIGRALNPIVFAANVLEMSSFAEFSNPLSLLAFIGTAVAEGIYVESVYQYHIGCQSRSNACSSWTPTQGPDAIDPFWSNGWVISMGSGGTYNWATYLGGSQISAVTSVAIGPDGIYLAGETQSADFPVTQGAYGGQCTSSSGPPLDDGFLTDPWENLAAGFISKLSADGKTLIRSTCTNADVAPGDLIAGYGAPLYIGLQGTSPVIAGNTFLNAPFPNINGYPITPTLSSYSFPGFIFQLAPDFSRPIMSSTFFNRTEDFSVDSLTTDGAGHAYLLGSDLNGGNLYVSPGALDLMPQGGQYVLELDLNSAAKANQIISFGAIPKQVWGSPDFYVIATASSGLPVAFAASGACTITGNTVHMTGAGYCTITASQPGDTNYGAAVNVSQTFAIGPQNLSASVGVQRGGFVLQLSTGRYAQTVTLTNNSGATIIGPVSLVLDNLSNNAGLYNGSGRTSSLSPPASPYVNLNINMAPSQRVSVVLQFADPTKTAISYSTRVLAGPGSR